MQTGTGSHVLSRRTPSRMDRTGSIPDGTRSNISCGAAGTRSSSARFPAKSARSLSAGSHSSSSRRYCANTKLHFGAQSGSDAVLRRLRRGHTVADVITAVELCRDHAITPIVDFIVGLPFETDEDQRATVDLIQWVTRSGTVHLHRFIPLPGTPLAGTHRAATPERDRKTLRKACVTGKTDRFMGRS